MHGLAAMMRPAMACLVLLRDLTKLAELVCTTGLPNRSTSPDVNKKREKTRQPLDLGLSSLVMVKSS